MGFLHAAISQLKIDSLVVVVPRVSIAGSSLFFAASAFACSAQAANAGIFQLFNLAALFSAGAVRYILYIKACGMAQRIDGMHLSQSGAEFEHVPKIERCGQLKKDSVLMVSPAFVGSYWGRLQIRTALPARGTPNPLKHSTQAKNRRNRAPLVSLCIPLRPVEKWKLPWRWPAICAGCVMVVRVVLYFIRSAKLVLCALGKGWLRACALTLVEVAELPRPYGGGTTKKERA